MPRRKTEIEQETIATQEMETNEETNETETIAMKTDETRQRKPRKKSAKSDDTVRKIREKDVSEITADETDDEKNYMLNFSMDIKQFTISRLRQLYNKGDLDFNADIQRGEVWNKNRASRYIHSLLLDLSAYQPPFLMNKRTNEDNTVTYEVLDGKQRGLPTIIRYLNNEYSLCGLSDEPYINFNGTPVNINGLRFSQLPDGLQKELESVSIPVAISTNATQKQKSLIFSRANNYKPMSKFDLARANKKDMSDILTLAQHEIFNVMCGKKVKSLDFHKIIVESYIIENEEEPILSSTHINSLMAELYMSDDEQTRLASDYDMILSAYKIILADDNKEIMQAMFNVTNFLSYLSFVGKFSNPKACAEWLTAFYSGIPDEYVETTNQGHTNNTTFVKTRMEIVENSIDEFLENYSSDDNEMSGFDEQVILS